MLTDHFTEFAWAAPTRDQTAATTAHVLWRHGIQPFGCPKRFHVDQCPTFESAVIRELFNVYGALKSRTTPCYPQVNGSCERFNKTLLNLLGTLEENHKATWTDYVQELVCLYNNTIHATMSQTPCYLLFGQHA